MPKRPRQSHIPSQVRRRKPRREGVVQNLPEPVFADEPTFVPPTSGSGPVDTRPRRRLEALARGGEGGITYRSAAGQLPTFERAYLVRELKLIGFTSLSLLAVIIALALILR